ncbi:CHAT domain-containing protein [Streptosporangiaceae bacterium NEAU-GS5]|nr:CHAT domain-containing protein [Streptosporangiaceae bacterium NEAU-GS5]
MLLGQWRRKRRLSKVLDPYWDGAPDSSARQDLDEALEIARWLVRKKPRLGTWMFLSHVQRTRWQVLGGQDDRTEALGILDRVLAEDTQEPETIAEAAQIYLALGEEATAVALLSEVRATAPDPVGAEADWALAMIYALRYWTPAGTVDDLESATGMISGLLEGSRLASSELLTEELAHRVLGPLLTLRSGMGLSQNPEEDDVFLALRRGQDPAGHPDIDAAMRHLALAVSSNVADADSAVLLGTLLLTTAADQADPGWALLQRAFDALAPQHPQHSRLDAVLGAFRCAPGPDVPPGDDRFIRHMEAFLLDRAATDTVVRVNALTFLGESLCHRGAELGDTTMCDRSIDAFCEAMAAMEPGHRFWTRTVGRLGLVLCSLRVNDQNTVDLDRVAERLAGRTSPVDLFAIEFAHGWRDPTGTVFFRATDRLAGAMAAADPDDQGHKFLLRAVMGLGFERYIATQDLGYLDLAQRCADGLRVQHAWDKPHPSDPMEGMSALVDVLKALHRRDPSAAAEAAERLRRFEGDWGAEMVGVWSSIAAALNQDDAGVLAGLDLAGDGPESRGMAAMLRGLADRDPDAISRSIDMQRRAGGPPAGSHFAGLWSLEMLLGMAFCHLYELTGARGDLEEAIRNLEASVAQRDSNPLVPHTAQMLTYLAVSHRNHSLGEGPAIDLGLEALRARLREVQLQSGPETMLAMSKAAAGEAVRVASWCITDGRLDDLVKALELGRGLVLQAANSVLTVPDLLREAGADDLAAVWEAAAETTTEQRLRALTVLGDSSLQRPATAGEIAGALRATGADALVYLVPGIQGATGGAVLVRPDATVSVLTMMSFHQDDGPIKDYAAAHAAYLEAYGTAAEEAASDEWARALGGLCDWAGPTVMEPVLEEFADAPGPLRLVLVPWGFGGIVPWHAARLGDEHLCTRAVVSYAASGRQLIDAVARPYRPLHAKPVIVADPMGEVVPNSRRECAEIGRASYPYATRLGRWTKEETRPATADALMAVLPEVSMLHYSGHAFSAAWAADSYLHVAASDGVREGAKLAVKDILRFAPQRQEPGAVVVLTACLSDVARESHDEALTLSTALLATVAAGVVGARWLVADDPRTATMMAMFHRHLDLTPEDPALALRRTQAWMLDPGRRLPADFSPQLRRLTEGLDFADARIWAAFTYQGR